MPFPWGELGPRYNVTWSEAYLHTKWHLDPSNHLATITSVTDRTTGEPLLVMVAQKLITFGKVMGKRIQAPFLTTQRPNVLHHHV